MKRYVLGFGLGLLLPAVAMGQSLQERVDKIEKKLQEQGKGIAAALGVDIHALVAADYLYNFGNPDSHTNQIRVFDSDANSFTLNQANLWIGRQKEDEDFGFVANLDFGKTAEVVGAVTAWKANGDLTGAESQNSFELREGYLTYKAPIGDGVTFKAGKFVTLHGAEVIKNYNALNYTVSNSLLFGFAIPFTHTGIMASFPLGEAVAVDLGVVNGWDNVIDNNDGKSVHGGLKITPAEMFSMYFSGTWGPELTDNGDSKRTMVTALFTLMPVDQLTLIADLNWADESDSVFCDPADPLNPCASTPRFKGDASWYGGALYAIYNVDDRLSFTLRGEIFDDPDGVRTLVAVSGREPGVTLWEITPAVTYKLTDGLWARAEYRRDEADRRIFDEDGSGDTNHQDTVAAELIYAF